MVDDFLHQVVNSTFGAEQKLLTSSAVAGGCINTTVKLETSSGVFFLKWRHDEPDLFEKEKLGLEMLRLKSPIQIPKVLASGAIGSKNFLLLEFIGSNAGKEHFWEDFGRNLARQHRQTTDHFGLDYDNHIGRLPQKNRWEESWIDFFIENRIEPQLRIGQASRLVSNELWNSFEVLFKKLKDLFPIERASLLHGDLWCGNFMTAANGEACIYDPAVYYGHREMELAFTRMFGGFDTLFYSSYHEEWPLKPRFEERIAIYNLYPLLVHLNLFGASYLAEIQQTLRRFS